MSESRKAAPEGVETMPLADQTVEALADLVNAVEDYFDLARCYDETHRVVKSLDDAMTYAGRVLKAHYDEQAAKFTQAFQNTEAVEGTMQPIPVQPSSLLPKPTGTSDDKYTQENYEAYCQWLTDEYPEGDIRPISFEQWQAFNKAMDGHQWPHDQS